MGWAGRILATISVIVATSSSALAGMVQLLDGTVHEGAVSVEGGLLVRGTSTVRVALSNVMLARFTDEAASTMIPPGLVLTNGTRIAGSFSSLADTTVLMESKGLRLPGKDIAWAVFTPFASALAADVPAGKTGALLPAGDFFEGSIKGADTKSAKVLNPIFGPRTFAAERKELHAVILRPVVPQAAAFEVVTRDGSRYLALDVVIREPGSIILRHPHYDGLRIEAAELVEVRVAPSRMVALGEVKPTRVTGNVSLADADKAAIQLGAQHVAGYAMTGGASATWKKTTRGGNFVARAAATGASGSLEKMTFVVEADGRLIFRTPAIGANDASVLIRCAMPAAEAITLRIDGAPTVKGTWADPMILLR
jgi:hypothetical protein